MAQPARKQDEDDQDEVAGQPSNQPDKSKSRSIPGGGGQSSDINPSVLRLANESRQRKRTQDTNRAAQEEAASRYQPLSAVNRNPAPHPDDYQPLGAVNRNVKPPLEYQPSAKKRTGLEGAAYKAGQAIGGLDRNVNKGLDRLDQHLGRGGAKPAGASPAQSPAAAPGKPAAATAPKPPLPLGNLNTGKIADKAAKGDLKGAAGQALTDIGAGKALGDALFIIWGLLFFVAGLIPLLGFFQAIPILIIFNFLLISPKTVYRITELILDLVGVGEVLQTLDTAGVGKTKITIRTVEKAGIIIMDLGFLLWHGLFVFGMIYYTCQSVTIGSNLPIIGGAIDLGARGAEYVTGLPISQVREFCKPFTGTFASFGGGGDFGGGGAGGSWGGNGTPDGSVQQYAALMNQIAQTNNIEYCALEALVKKESGGRANIYSSRDGGIRYIDSNHPDKKTYGLNFNDGYGHGIGLIQVFIYSKPRADAVWQDSQTPSRRGDGFGRPGGFLTVTDLINPETNLRAGTVLWATLIRRNNGDLKEAYRDYQGPTSAQATLDKLYDYYTECKQRQ